MRKIEQFKDALEADHRSGEIHRRGRQPLKRAIKLSEVRAEGHDGTDGE